MGDHLTDHLRRPPEEVSLTSLFWGQTTRRKKWQARSRSLRLSAPRWRLFATFWVPGPRLATLRQGPAVWGIRSLRHGYVRSPSTPGPILRATATVGYRSGTNRLGARNVPRFWRVSSASEYAAVAVAPFRSRPSGTSRRCGRHRDSEPRRRRSARRSGSPPGPGIGAG
jgi:hypothetical protein